MNPAEVKKYTLKQFSGPMGWPDRRMGIHVIATEGWGRSAQPVTFPFRSDHFVFLLVRSGSLRVKLNDEDGIIEKHQLILVAPHVIRQFIDMSADCKLISVFASEEFIESIAASPELCSSAIFSARGVYQVLDIKEADIDIILSLVDTLKLKIDSISPDIQHDKVSAHLFLAFINQIATLDKKCKCSFNVSRADQLLLHFLELLGIHIKHYHGIKNYADLLHVSPKYLSQTIKKSAGKTAGEYIDERLVLEAKILLQRSDLSIGQVADSLHFADQFIFSKYFKRHTGMTPKAYRDTA